MLTFIKRIFFSIIFILSICGVLAIGYFIFDIKQVKNEKYTVNKDGQAVIKEIQKLQRLETSSFTIEKIIEMQKQGNEMEQLLFGDKILLIASGQVVAGFDFSKIATQSVSLNNDTIVLTLPPPEILFSRLDNQKTRVYDRKQGFFTKGDKDLESKAREEAEKSIRQSACDGGILIQASEQGEKQLKAFFSMLGFSNSVIKIQQGICK